MEWIPRGLPSIHAPIPICVQPKAGQKRPATSPAPLIPSPHHLQSPSGTTTVGGGPTGMNNHVVTSNHMGVGSPVGPPQSQCPTGSGGGGSSGGAGANGGTSGRGPFASALRNLAKQADIKEEEEGSARDRGISANSGNPPAQNPAVQRTSSANDSRLDGRVSADDRSSSAQLSKKRAVASPQPPEKIARLNATSSAMQPELLARSGFQPYRSDERLMPPAGAFPLDAYTPFAGLAGMPPGALFNPAALPYAEQLYLDQRFQSMFRAGAHHPHPHPHPLYSPMASPYASHLYSMLPGGAAALGLGVPGLHERLKMEEEHRARLAREEERERELQREKERELREQREREQREKEQREREQREKEQREKEQREKEQRERELREKEREARERERMISASHHYSSQLYSPLQRNLLAPILPPIGLGLRPPQSSLHALPTISPYHSSTQRQSPHAAMGLNLALGLQAVPNLPHPPPPNVHSSASLNLSHHLPPTSLSLGHPGAGLSHHSQVSLAAMAAHSSSSSSSLSLGHSGLGLSHPGLNLTHPHMSSHPAVSVAHQIPPHSQHQGLSLPTTTSPHCSLNLSQNSSAISKQNADVIAHPSSVSQSTGGTTNNVVTSLCSNIPSAAQPLNSSMYYSHHPSHHQTSSHHQSPLPPSSVSQHQSSVSISLAHNHHSSSPVMKNNNRTPTPSSMQNASNTHSQNGGRASSSPVTRNEKDTATLDLTSQQSNQATGGSTNSRTTPSLSHEIINGSNTISDQSDSSKDGPIIHPGNTNSKDDAKTPEDKIMLPNNSSNMQLSQSGHVSTTASNLQPTTDSGDKHCGVSDEATPTIPSGSNSTSGNINNNSSNVNNNTMEANKSDLGSSSPSQSKPPPLNPTKKTDPTVVTNSGNPVSSTIPTSNAVVSTSDEVSNASANDASR